MYIVMLCLSFKYEISIREFLNIDCLLINSSVHYENKQATVDD